MTKNNKCVLPVILMLAASLIFTGCGRKTRDEKLYREQAIGFMENGDYGAAIVRFNDALAQKDGRYGKLEIDILKYRAEAEYLNADYKTAAETYERLCREDGEKTDYINMRVLCMARADADLKKAVELYDKGGEKDGDAEIRKQALYELGAALVRSDFESYHDEAERIYREALADEASKSGELYNRVGMMLFDKGDYEKALDYLKEGVRFVKSDIQKLAMAESAAANDDDGKSGDTENSTVNQGDEENVIKYRETESLKSLQYNIAVCYEYMSEYEKALNQFKEYRETFGSDDELEHEITFLESRVAHLHED